MTHQKVKVRLLPYFSGFHLLPINFFLSSKPLLNDPTTEPTEEPILSHGGTVASQLSRDQSESQQLANIGKMLGVGLESVVPVRCCSLAQARDADAAHVPYVFRT